MAPPRFPPSSSAARLPPRSTPPEPRPSPPAAAAGAAALAPGSLEEVLLQAAFDGNLRLVRKMARALDEGDGRRLGDKVGAVRDGNGVGALHLAAGRGSLPVCGYLLEELRVDIDAVEDRGETALTFAINSGNADMVRYLLDHGADTEKLNNDGLTVLHFASGEVFGRFVDPRYLEDVAVVLSVREQELKIFLVGAVLTKLVSSLPSRDACRVESPRC